MLMFCLQPRLVAIYRGDVAGGNKRSTQTQSCSGNCFSVSFDHLSLEGRVLKMQAINSIKIGKSFRYADAPKASGPFGPRR